jgi:hypothetical protein
MFAVSGHLLDSTLAGLVADLEDAALQSAEVYVFGHRRTAPSAGHCGNGIPDWRSLETYAKDSIGV